jgi:hypothetical protein
MSLPYAPFMTTSKHGSEESDDDLQPSPARSTLSSTVSFPPGSQQGLGVRTELNPLLENVGSLEEALLPYATISELATPQELIRYLEYKGTPTEAVDQISQHRLTGEVKAMVGGISPQGAHLILTEFHKLSSSSYINL